MLRRPTALLHLFPANSRNLSIPTGRTAFSGGLRWSALGRAMRGWLVGWGLVWGITVLAWAEESGLPQHLSEPGGCPARQTNPQGASPPQTGQPRDPAPVWVRLRNGRVLVGHLDLRTTGEELWLRTGSDTLSIIRPIGWDQVVEICLDGQPIPAVFLQRFLEVLLERAISAQDSSAPPIARPGLQLSETEIQLLPPSLREFLHGVQTASGKPGPKSPGRIILEGNATEQPQDAGGAPSPRSCPLPDGHGHPKTGDSILSASASRRTAYLVVDAWLGQWDADVEADGIVVEITPYQTDGQPAPVHGMLEVTLVIPPRGATGALDQKSHRQRWVQRVRREDFSPATGSAQYRLPFGSAQNNPEWNLDLAGYGAVTAQLSVPGQGSFSAAVGYVRVRPFSPVRDRLQQSTGRRFFPWEQTQP